MNGEYSHNEYYEQWVTDEMMDYVVSKIGADRLLGSTDEHFNDIPLPKWDGLSVMDYINQEDWIESRLSVLDPEVHENNRLAHKQRKFAYSSSDSVCVSKAAARKYIDLMKNTKELAA